MLVYVEYAVIENLIIDYFLLKTSLYFSRASYKWYKILFAVCLGTAFAIVLPLVNINNKIAFFIKILREREKKYEPKNRTAFRPLAYYCKGAF